MNIDVTATDGDRTWSEKFTDVKSVITDSGSLVVLSEQFTVVPTQKGRNHFEDDVTANAAFAPGSWHSWRRTD